MTKISNIQYIGEEEQQCIMVDSKDHLYITKDNIVTHNTMVASTLSELAFFREAGKSDEYIMRFYNDTKSRVWSRMKGNYWGRVILDSSPNDIESPIDQYCMYEAQKDPLNYVVSGSHWKWVPEDYKDVNDTFPVFKGSNGKPPRILTNTEGFEPVDIIQVPKELKQFFINDLRKSLKDLAGIPQGSQDKLFYDYEKIDKIFHPQLRSIETCIHADARMSPHDLIWNQVREEFFLRSGQGFQFYYKPSIPRVFHIDQSLVNDMSAIAFVHVERQVELTLDFYETKKFDILRDVIYVVDLIVPIHPYGGRINLDAIKEFILDIRNKGQMPLIHGSFDTFQSEASIQHLERNAIKMENLSVDETLDPYLFLAQIIEQGNLKVGRNIFLKNNLKSLQVTQRKKTNSLKIDHSMGESPTPTQASDNWETSMLGINAKDVSDAVCGAVYNAYKYLATDGRNLLQTWDENRIMLTGEDIKKSTYDFIKRIGFAG